MFEPDTPVASLGKVKSMVTSNLASGSVAHGSSASVEQPEVVTSKVTVALKVLS